MADIAGSINGGTCVQKVFGGAGSREVWLISVSFAAYTGASDTLSIDAVGAAIDALARDGKTSTLRWGVSAYPGYDTNDQAVFASGTSVQALTVSSDNLEGHLAVEAGTEVTTATASSGVGVLVGVNRV